MLGLGIKNPLVRVVVWMAGCASLSAATLIAGAVGLVVLAFVLAWAWTTRVSA